MNIFKKRIDELGRIVIPKEIRNTLKINNFDEIEMIVENNCLILKKSLGLENYKDKLDRLVNFLSNEDFRIIITDKNNVISSNCEGIYYRNEFIFAEDGYIENEKICGYIKCFKIIIDSNNFGNLYFISKNNYSHKLEKFKVIKDLIIDLIK